MTSPTNTWQPIETAPKNGSKFIGRYASGNVFVTWWQSFNAWGPQKEGGGCDVVGQTYAWAHDETGAHGYGIPTHWVPMPEMPE